jgi:hypothetical protein
VGWLSGTIFHESYPEPALRAYWRKIHRYAELEARQRALSGSHGNRWVRSAGKLALMLFVRGGILDGPTAWIWIAGQSYMEWLVLGRSKKLMHTRSASVSTDAI